MGFLNNTTITIDAILTKRGRELLARGRNEFAVTKFAIADDEVDYRLWDTHILMELTIMGQLLKICLC